MKLCVYILLLCVVVSASALAYTVRLTADAPPVTCEFFINSLDCEADNLRVNK